MEFPARAIYGLDIETDTTIDGRDPLVARILSVAVATADRSTCVVFESHDEQEMLESLNATLNALPAGMVATWNGSGFDLAFLMHRASVHNVVLDWQVTDSDRTSKYPPVLGTVLQGTLGPHRHVDVAYAFMEYAADNNVKWSLKPVARSLGMEPVEVDRANTHLLSQEVLAEYVASDAVVTACLAEILKERITLWVD